MKKIPLVLCLLIFAAGVCRSAVLIPQPKQVAHTAGTFTLKASTQIVTDKPNLATAEYLRSELRKLFGVECKVVQALPKGDSRSRIILQAAAKGRVPGNPEGYTLSVGKGRVVVKSSGAAGVFYGVQTLKQLLQQTDSGVVAQVCEIRDNPALAWRGVYLNVRSLGNGQASIQAMKDLFNAFASLKMNTLFLEIADNIQFDKQQFPLSATHAPTKAQVRDLVDYAKSLHFEVIPTLQTLSHCVWVLENPKNVELLEGGQQAGWNTAWCPSNPAVDELAKDVIEETIDVFHPKYFHIGMDEVNYGPFGECPLCKEKKPSELFLGAITRMRDIIAAKGVKTIMWHDTLLPAGQYMTGATDKARGWEIVDKVPKDIIIADWDYGVYGKASQKQLRYFTDKGFKVLGATFCAPKGIQTFAEGLSKEPNALGLFDTLWFYANNWTKPETQAPEAWAAVTLTAQYAWNPTTPTLSAITYDPVYELAKLIKPAEPGAGKWAPVSLEKYLNYRISGAKDSWPGYDPGDTLEKVFSKDITSGQVKFQMAKGKTANNAILLSAQGDDGLPAGPVTIELGRKANKLAFLLTCNVPMDKDSLNTWSRATAQPLVGKYTIEYTDGSSEDTLLLYRWNIVDWNYKFGVFGGRIAYSGETAAGSRIQLIRTDWTNPHPEKTIKGVTLASSNQNGMSLAVFALSAESGRGN